MPLHHLARARRIGDQDHGPALRAEARERVTRFRCGGDAVVDDAPDIAEQDVVGGRERAQNGR